ncbi:MAG: hypothetical protein ACFNWW_02910 [Negativicutes bacterium]
MAKEKPPGAGARVAVTLRLPAALYEELKREAAVVGCTLHEHILFQLSLRKKILP